MFLNLLNHVINKKLRELKCVFVCIKHQETLKTT